VRQGGFARLALFFRNDGKSSRILQGILVSSLDQVARASDYDATFIRLDRYLMIRRRQRNSYSARDALNEAENSHWAGGRSFLAFFLEPYDAATNFDFLSWSCGLQEPSSFIDHRHSITGKYYMADGIVFYWPRSCPSP
jgi:hypothetical protein